MRARLGFFGHRSVALGVLAVSTLASLAVRADDIVPSLDLRGFEPPTDPEGGLAYEPARTPATLDPNFALWLSYAHRPIVLLDRATGDSKFAVLGSQLVGDFVANVGFFGRFAVGVDVPFVLFQDGDDPRDPANAAALRTVGDYALPAQALGDMRLVVKGTMLPPTSGEFGGFSVAMVERLSLPTGDRASFLGEGAVASDTRILAEYGVVAVAVHAQLGVKLRGEHEDFACAALPRPGEDGIIVELAPECPTRFGGELPFGLAVSVKPKAFGFDPDGHFTWFLETYGHVPLSPHAPFSDARLAQLQLGGGARYVFDNDISLLGALDAALVGGVGTAPLHAALSVGYAPRKHDVDDDRVRDKDDVCHDLPEDHDGFEDADGCPEWDNDGDTIPDLEDHCPDVSGIASQDPTLRGCPDPDPDKDAVLGAADQCAEVAEDRDGFADDDGCPEPDNDGDGVSDASDACRDLAGVASERAAEHGCPDGDLDGVADAVDACPTEKGVRGAAPSKDGCAPEPEPPLKKKGGKKAAPQKAAPQKPR